MDDIKLPNILPSVSAAGRINKVKRRESNRNDRRFDRQLTQEQKKEEETEDEQATECEQQRLRRTKLINAEPGSDRDDHDDGMKKDQGKLVDVVI